MASILVFTEYANTDFKRGTYELLSACQTSGLTTHALVLGARADDMATKLGVWGVKAAITYSDAQLDKYNPELFTQVIGDVLSKEKYDFILASSSMLARDLFPRVAQKVDAGIATDCTSLRFVGGQIEVEKPLYSGKCTAAVEFQNCNTRIVLMRANQLPVGAPGSGHAEIRKMSVAPTDLRTKIREIVRGASEKLDLTEANIIVAGGRGMKGPEHFKLLEDIANTLGATVGASRAVVDAGWVSHSMQVGQTGKTVAPTLYIACGISGAIQHLAGMSGSKVIVAINTDPDAPIFQKATYGIVGDVFTVLPALNEEFKAMLK